MRIQLGIENCFGKKVKNAKNQDRNDCASTGSGMRDC